MEEVLGHRTAWIAFLKTKSHPETGGFFMARRWKRLFFSVAVLQIFFLGAVKEWSVETIRGMTRMADTL